ncbi:MAG: hypothetical protein Aurels2KO_40330 [Aureliella sp.]
MPSNSADPEKTTGSRRNAMLMLLGMACAGASGCRWIPPLSPIAIPGPRPQQPIPVPVSNPSTIPPVEPDFLWRQIVDSVDDHFRIDVENPVRRTETLWQEGLLETYPVVSGTIFEPWRKDAAPGFERLQSTVQTIRRTATIKVLPVESGYAIDIRVLKEQEDVDQSQFAAAGSSAQRHDGTIVRTETQVRQLPITLGWFEIGRDRELEQRLMANILGRISNIEKPPPL